MNVKIDDLSDEIQSILSEYEKDAQEVVDESIKKAGKDAVKELKKTSPKNKGNYAKGWKSKVEKSRLGDKVIVYNTVYYLTHLLENGHAKVGGGRVEGKPHIKPASDKAAKNAIELIKKGIKGI